jgi:hypothetical protein
MNRVDRCYCPDYAHFPFNASKIIHPALHNLLTLIPPRIKKPLISQGLLALNRTLPDYLMAERQGFEPWVRD